MVAQVTAMVEVHRPNSTTLQPRHFQDLCELTHPCCLGCGRRCRCHSETLPKAHVMNSPSATAQRWRRADERFLPGSYGKRQLHMPSVFSHSRLLCNRRILCLHNLLG